MVGALQHDPDPEIRGIAAEALSRSGGENTISVLMNATEKDLDTEVRAEAVAGLGRLQARDAAPLLESIATTTDAPASLRGNAIEALGRLGIVSVLPTLITLLNEPPPETPSSRHPADPFASSTIFSSWSSNGRWRNSDPHNISEAAANAMEALLAHARWDRRSGNLEPADVELLTRAEEALLEVLDGDGATSTRAAAALALDHAQGSAVLAALSGQTGQSISPEVRRAAIQALGLLHDPDVLPVLTNALQQDPDLEGLVAEALGMPDVTEAAPTLISLLNSKESEVRSTAARALGICGSPDAVPVLARTLESDRREDVRVACAGSLGLFVDARALPSLQGALKDRSTSVRQAAAWSLGHIGDATAVPVLIKVLSDRDNQVRFIAGCALAEIGDPSAREALAAQLEDRDSMVQLSGAVGLMFLGDDRAMDLLREALESPDTWQHYAAVMALIRHSSPETRELLSATAAHRGESGEGLIHRAVDPGGPAAFHAGLTNPRQDIRLWSASALTLLKDRGSLEVLVRALDDPDSDVREAALQGVRRIRRLPSQPVQ